MYPTWRQWCRLCAKEESTIDMFLKNENGVDLAAMINKYFGLLINQKNSHPLTICTTCYHYLLSLDKFADRVGRVEAMYSTIIYENITSIDYTTLKYQFGLVKEEPSPVQSSFVTRSDQSTDTNDLLSSPTDESNHNETIYVRELTTASKTGVDNVEKIEEDNNSDMFMMEQMYDGDSDEDDDKDDIAVDYLEINEPHENSSETDEEDSNRKSKIKIEKEIEQNPLSSEPFKCNYCSMEFTSRARLRYHRNRKHPLAKVGFPCEKCGKKCPTEQKAKIHAMLHVELRDKPEYPCTYCDKQFTKPTNLQMHIRVVHIGEKPFICEACGKPFATRGALKEHNFTHVDERPFQCPSCPKKFKTVARLKSHQDIHNGTMYVCPNCGLILNTRRTLNMHMVVHSDKKNYKCNVCASEFKRAKALKNHLILHSGLRPYTCPFCDKTFANGSNCRSHKKKAHPQELAAMEAAGQAAPAANIPKLEQLKSC